MPSPDVAGGRPNQRTASCLKALPTMSAPGLLAARGKAKGSGRPCSSPSRCFCSSSEMAAYSKALITAVLPTPQAP
jgi:hypothetical protein